MTMPATLYMHAYFIHANTCIYIFSCLFYREDMYVDMSKSSSPAYQNLPPVSPGCEENQAEKFPEASGIYESIL